MNSINSESIGCQSYGIFWDIENCPIPPRLRAANVIQSIKQFISTRYETKVGHQSEPCTFFCSCDTKLLDKTYVEALNRSGVDILHVNPVRPPNGVLAPNGMAYKVNADCKLIECIHKYVDHHFNTNKCLLFVITGDIDFATAIRTAKRRGFEVILLYGTNTSQEIKNCATESHSYYDIVEPVKCMFEGNGSPPDPQLATLFNTVQARNSQPPSASTATSVQSLCDRATASAQTNRAAATNSSVPPFIKEVQNTVRSIETQNKSRTKSVTKTDEMEYNSEKVKTVQEVVQCERHVALRVLQSTHGDVTLAINLLINE